MPGLPRLHHYVTKSYLDGFLEPDTKQPHCYMRRKSRPFLTTPANLANIRDFHSFKRHDDSIDTSLETQIEREIETPGIPLLRTLASGKVNFDKQRSFIARLVALQHVRVPLSAALWTGTISIAWTLSSRRWTRILSVWVSR